MLMTVKVNQSAFPSVTGASGSGCLPRIYHLGAQAGVYDQLISVGLGIPGQSVLPCGVNQQLLGIHLPPGYSEILRQL